MEIPNFILPEVLFSLSEEFQEDNAGEAVWLRTNPIDVIDEYFDEILVYDKLQNWCV